MICVYAADAEDFSTNGLAVLTPSSCTVTETLNGEWELSMTHPLDDRDKWTYLQAGNIIRAPVPAAMTPQVSMPAIRGSSYTSDDSDGDTYTITTQSGPLRLRAKPSTSAKILGTYKKGSTVTVLEKTNSEWYEVSASGTHGYMSAQYLTKSSSSSSGTTSGASASYSNSHQVRDQPFRIYRIVPSLDKVEVYARHIFYDLMDNYVTYNSKTDVTGAEAAQQIFKKCKSDHPFTLYTNVTTKGTVDCEDTNPAEALMGDEGVLNKCGGELTRDWYDVYVVDRVGKDTDVEIREGKNLTSVSYDVDISSVVTRIVPTGEDSDGEILYLPETYIDSPNIGKYPHVKWGHIAVSDAKEDDDTSKSEVYAKLREEAQKELDNGCDLPTVTLTVNFISIDDTEEYKNFGILHSIFLGDAVRVAVPKLGLSVALRMTQYTYDCLLNKYSSCTLGSTEDSVESSLVSASQLAAGSIGNIKLALGSVGSGQLQAGSVGSLQVKTAAIGTAHIQQAAITTAQIADATIQMANISQAAIDALNANSATIADAHIGSATIQQAQISGLSSDFAHISDGVIDNAEVDYAHIQTAAVEKLNAEAADVAKAEIGKATIEQAQVHNLSSDYAHITSGKIDNASIDYAHIDSAAITQLSANAADVADAQIAKATITQAQVENLSSDFAHLTNGAIDNATIDAAKVNNLSAGYAHITDGAIDNATIAAAKVTGLDADVASITNATIATATIQAAQVNGLQAEIATATEAAVKNLTVTTAQIENFSAAVSALAEASITTANIRKADIDWASIDNLSTQIAAVADAQIGTASIKSAQISDLAANVMSTVEANIGTASIDWASISSLQTGIATIVQAKIGEASITSAQITDLDTTVGTIAEAKISNADINWAHITGLTADTMFTTNAVATKVYIQDLAVTDAQIASLTAGEIVVKGGDGLMYRLSVAADGEVIATKAQVQNDDFDDGTISGGKLIENSVTTKQLNAEEIFAKDAAVTSLISQNIDTDTVVARYSHFGEVVTNVLHSDEGQALLLDAQSGIYETVRQNTSDLSAQISAAQNTADAAQETASAASEATAANAANISAAESRIAQLGNSITSTVQSMESKLETKADASDVTEISGQVSTLQQTAGGLSASVTSMQGDVNALSSGLSSLRDTVTTYMSFNEDGLEIGKSTDSATVNISNSAVEFRQGGTTVASIDNNRLSITNAEITNSLTVGHYELYRVAEDNSMAFYWHDD